MVMQEHSRRLAEPLRWGKREKAAVAAVLACVVLALLGLGAYALTGGARPRVDCVSVTFASTLGAAELHGCGPQARRICASGSFRNIERALRLACQRAGFAYRAPN